MFKVIALITAFVVGVAVATAIPMIAKGCGPWLDNVEYEVYVAKQKLLGEPYYVRKCD